MARSTLPATPDAQVAPPLMPGPDGSPDERDPREVNNRPWPLLLFKTMRPKQWTKNAVVFGALVFAFRLSSVTDVALTVAAFFLFCFLSSAVYIMNDLAD